MKSAIVRLACLAVFQAFSHLSTAQCSFTPSITPNNLILCPASQDTLWTQVYDSYQWNKAGNPIPGATQQYLVVDAFNDAGYYFTVDATLAACTERSDSVLVDGWAFLPPFVIQDGDFSTDPSDGHIITCNPASPYNPDSFYLIMAQPYTSSIQWFLNGSPISGATNDSLLVTQTGNYTAEGAPAICPAYIQPLGLDIYVEVRNPVIPVISQSGSVLVSTPGAPALSGFQWYLNGNPIAGANSPGYTPVVSGAYTVSAEDAYCSTISLPFQFTAPSGIDNVGLSDGLSICPNPAKDVISIAAAQPFSVKVYNQLGQEVYTDQTMSSSKKADLSRLPQGLYSIKITGGGEVITRQLLRL